MESSRRTFDYDPVRYVAPTLLGGWVNYGPDHPEAGYTKQRDGVVRMRGLVKNGAFLVPVFYLPVGFRPARILHLATVSNGAFGYVRVFTDGMVDFPLGSASWFSLDGLSFDTRP